MTPEDQSVLETVPAHARIGRRALGDHLIQRGEVAELWLRVVPRRDRSTYRLTRRGGSRTPLIAAEPVSKDGWNSILTKLAREDPDAARGVTERAHHQAIWDEINKHEIDVSIVDLYLVGGFGVSPFRKTESHDLRFGDDYLVISRPGRAISPITYNEVQRLAIDGQTLAARGGFVGGGVVVEGAAEGMAMAAVPGALTTRTDIRTVVELHTTSSHFVLVSVKEQAHELRLRLLPVQARLRPGGDAHELLSRLERLADLHARGALTDQEFSAAKARMLSD